MCKRLLSKTIFKNVNKTEINKHIHQLTLMYVFIYFRYKQKYHDEKIIIFLGCPWL